MNEVTLERMASLRLEGMRGAFERMLQAKTTEALTIDQAIGMLIDAEWDARKNRRMEQNLKNARFRYKACMAEIDYVHSRGLDRNQMARFSDCAFIRNAESVLVIGPTGVGKSYLASALGEQACQMGYKVLYENATRLFAQLKMKKVDGTYIDEIEKLGKNELLILDDLFLQPLDSSASLALMEIMEDRYARKSLIITSQYPPDKWWDMIKDKTIADALLDRLINASHKIILNGESMRRKKN